MTHQQRPAALELEGIACRFDSDFLKAGQARPAPGGNWASPGPARVSEQDTLVAGAGGAGWAVFIRSGAAMSRRQADCTKAVHSVEA